MKENILMVETTVESENQAKALATGAVENGFAACAQIDQPIRSIYHWKGVLEDTREYRIRFKLAAEKKQLLVDWLIANHPYECPELLISDRFSANPAYTQWVLQS